MKNYAVRFFAVFVIIFCLVLPAQGDDFSDIVVFGDSLSDSGNIYSATDGTYPPEPYQGRYSDGPVWVEYLAKSLGISGKFCNYAFGGAKTGLSNPDEMDAPGFLTQVAAYTELLTASGTFFTAFPQPGETLFIIWIGANDFLGTLTDPSAAVSDAVVNIQTGMTQLVDGGAGKFLVVNLPDLGLTPRMNNDAAASAGATQIASLFNSALESMLAQFESDHPGVVIVRLDTFSMLQDIIAHPDSWGFNNVTEPQLDTDTGIVAQGRYFFWDGIHPTTAAHKVIARQVATILQERFDFIGQPNLDAALNLTVPYVEFGNDTYGARFDYYQNPADPGGYYWKLDLSSVTEVDGM